MGSKIVTTTIAVAYTAALYALVAAVRTPGTPGQVQAIVVLFVATVPVVTTHVGPDALRAASRMIVGVVAAALAFTAGAADRLADSLKATID